jgi:hypothetical protein
MRCQGRGKNYGRAAFVGPLRENGTPYLRVLINGDHFLPSDLEIVKGERIPPAGGDSPDLIILGYDDIGSIARSEKIVLFDEAVRDELTFLHDHSESFVISRTTLVIRLRLRNADGPFVAALLRKSSRLASCLIEITGAVDLYGLARAAKFQRHTNPFPNQTYLEALLNNSRRVPSARLQLQRLIEHSNFDIRYRAAEALGLNLEQYVVLWARTGGPACRVKAIRWLCQRRKPDGLDFLVRYFGGPESDPVRPEIVRAFRDFPNPRTEELLLTAARRSGNDEATIAALEALGACGGKDALETVYGISQNADLSAPLREAARDAATAIRARLGEEESGRLSLAGDKSGEGGLSLAGQSGESDSSE